MYSSYINLFYLVNYNDTHRMSLSKNILSGLSIALIIYGSRIEIQEVFRLFEYYSNIPEWNLFTKTEE